MSGKRKDLEISSSLSGRPGKLQRGNSVLSVENNSLTHDVVWGDIAHNDSLHLSSPPRNARLFDSQPSFDATAPPFPVDALVCFIVVPLSLLCCRNCILIFNKTISRRKKKRLLQRLDAAVVATELQRIVVGRARARCVADVVVSTARRRQAVIVWPQRLDRWWWSRRRSTDGHESSGGGARR